MNVPFPEDTWKSWVNTIVRTNLEQHFEEATKIGRFNHVRLYYLILFKYFIFFNFKMRKIVYL